MFVKRFLLNIMVILGLMLNPVVVAEMQAASYKGHADSNHLNSPSSSITKTNINNSHHSSVADGSCHHPPSNKNYTRQNNITKNSVQSGSNDEQCSGDCCINCQHCGCSFTGITTVMQPFSISYQFKVISYSVAIHERPILVLYRPPITSLI